jgi:hypothetical protein
MRFRVGGEAGALPLGMWSGLLILDAVLGSRWLAGALTIPLGPIVAWGSTGLIAAASVTALALWRGANLKRFPRMPWWPEIAALSIPLAWGVTAARGTSPFTLGGLAALWLLTIVAIGFVSVWVIPHHGRAESGKTSFEHPAGVHDEFQSDGAEWQRRIRIAGGELIEGCARVEFAAGQKEALLHLAFCPPLAFVPVVHGEDANGGDVDVRAESVHTFGARLSVRRTAGSDAAEVREISYSAGPPEPNEVAA